MGKDHSNRMPMAVDEKSVLRWIARESIRRRSQN